MNKDICFVAKDCCIRVHKQARALKNLGYKVHLITMNREISTSYFESVLYYDSPAKLEASIKLVGAVTRLFHVHNEPSWPAAFVKEILPTALVVLDMHDSNHWRVDDNVTIDDINESISWYEEDIAVSMSDALITPSQSCRDQVVNRGVNKPVIFLPSVVLRDDMSQSRNSFSGGLVSQGGHVTPEVPGNHWRDYTALYEYLKGRKQVYAYSPNFNLEPPNATDLHYSRLGVKRGKFPYHEMLNQLEKHTWNLVGNWHPGVDIPVWEYALPNKFFDAMAALTPSVVIGASEPAKIVAEYGFGIVVDHPEELIDRWDEHIECRVNLRKHRMNFIMDEWIHRVADLYSNISGGDY